MLSDIKGLIAILRAAHAGEVQSCNWKGSKPLKPEQLSKYQI